MARLPGEKCVKVSTSRAEDLGFDSRLRRGDFSGSSHTSDLETFTSATTLPGAWCYRVSAGGLVGPVLVDLSCNFCLSVAARTVVCADPSRRCTVMLLRR